MKPQEWVGLFNVDRDDSPCFSGKIKFSLESGIVLEYRIAGTLVPPKSEVLYGILNSGEKCTLIGLHSFEHSGMNGNSAIVSRFGEIHFSYLIIGKFVQLESLYKRCIYSFYNLQEFIFPDGYKSFVKISKEPIKSIQLRNGTIEIRNHAVLESLNQDLHGQIFSNNDIALEKLCTAFKEIQSESDRSEFFWKKDLSYKFYRKSQHGLPIKDHIDELLKIGNLFSLLMNRPVYPDQIELVDDSDYKMNVFVGMYLDNKTFELAKKEISYFRMPIVQKDIELADVICEWLDKESSYSTVCSRIQHETGFKTESQLFGEIVLAATQFEMISFNDNIKSERFLYPIKKYGSSGVEQALVKLFRCVNQNDVGKGIAAVRNEIAHIGRPKVILNQFILSNISELAYLMNLVVNGYALKMIKVNDGAIQKFYENQI